MKVNAVQYHVVEYIKRGGSGEVYKVSRDGKLFALKVYFPFYQREFFTTHVEDQIQQTIFFQQREFEILSSLYHRNIVRVYEKGDVLLPASTRKSLAVANLTSLPALVTEYVDGVEIKTFFENNKVTADQCALMLIRIADALQYMHQERRRMHLDIKSANVLVRASDNEPILIDFGLSKNLDFNEVDRTERTKLLGDWSLFPELPPTHRLKQMHKGEGTREELSEEAFPALDLFQFGKLLENLDPQLNEIFEGRDLKYLEELRTTLTTWERVRTLSPTSLLPRIERLHPKQFMHFGIQELVAPSSAERTIMLPTGIAVPLTSSLQRGVECRSFRRLQHINQLCLLNFVYPGADYKRSVHVLYAYELARQLLEQLFSSPLFRYHFDVQAAQQLLACVLFHDINHFPFLHIFQEGGIKELESLDVMDLFCDGVATGELHNKTASVYAILDDLGISSDRFKRIVLKDHHEQQGEAVAIDQVINSVLSSGVDVDKLSYLRFDSLYSGVAYGQGVDIPALIKAARIDEVKGGRLHLTFDERALQALEGVVMARYWQFRSVYWHHTNRALMAMLLHVVRTLYLERGASAEDFLIRTMWKGDYEALRYLDGEFKTRTGADSSILGGLIEDRTKMYRRLYTVHANIGDDIDDEIWTKCKKLSYEQEKSLRLRLLESIWTLIGHSEKCPFTIEDLLVDIPKRENDSGGVVYVKVDGGEPRELAKISESIKQVQAGYDALAKRIRFFVSPTLSNLLGPAFRELRRNDLKLRIAAAISEVIVPSQVK